jgi:hypothetical protein
MGSSRWELATGDELVQRIKERNSAVRKSHTWFPPPVAPVEMPMGLNHLDSDFCWCDPIIEVDENGQEVVLHRQVTWN